MLIYIDTNMREFNIEDLEAPAILSCYNSSSYCTKLMLSIPELDFLLLWEIGRPANFGSTVNSGTG